MTSSARTSSFKSTNVSTQNPSESIADDPWKNFQFPITVKEYGAVTCVDFCREDFAVTSATRVQIYSCATNQVKKTISRFKETVYSARFRHDGQLMVAGGEEGIVKVFDMNSRAVLRQCEGHTKAIRQASFTTNGLQLLSSGDDKTLRSWDLSTGETLREFSGHEDYVRALGVSSGSSDICVTGSYDHTVKLWDLRCPSGSSPGVSMNHGAPVESVVVFPSASVCISAGDNRICVWDILSGGRQLFSFCNHQKTVTSLCLDSEAKQLLSGSVDRQLKVYDVTDYSVVQGLSYPAPILSIGLSQSKGHLVVGMSDGTLSIKRRPTKSSRSRDVGEEMSLALPSKPFPGTKRFFMRGKAKIEKGDLVVHDPRPMVHLKPYEAQLKKFRYTDALNAALKTSNCDIISSTFQDLIHRDGLSSALAGRNHKALLPIVKFLVHYISHPVYQPTVLDVANIVLDMYSGIRGESRRIDQQLTALRTRVEAELTMQRRMLSVLGMLDMLYAMAAVRK